MRKYMIPNKITVMFFTVFLCNMAMPYEVHAVQLTTSSQLSTIDQLPKAVLVAENDITNYFQVILSGKDPSSAKVIMNNAISVVEESYPQYYPSVISFYNTCSVQTAELAINNYFKAILAGNDPTSAKNIMLTAEAAVLAPADVQTVQAYYEQAAVKTAETAINNYFTVILAGNDPTSAKNIMLTAEAAVLAPADVQTVQAYYEQAAVKTAETAINNYFTVILAGNDPTTAKNIMLTAEAAVLSPADVQTVQAYYEKDAVITAEEAIKGYFRTILAGSDPTSAKAIMLTAEAAVLAPADVQSVQAFYEIVAVNSAEIAINNYFKAILAGNDPTTAKNIMLTAEAAVLAPADVQTVQAYYEKEAVSTAETAINNYFTVILAGNDPTTAKNIMLTAEAAVLSPADVQTVQAYYEQAAVKTAETAINNYFTVILAGNDPTTAKNIMLTAEAAVLSPADVQTVQAYYEKEAVITAEEAIIRYFRTILAGNDPTAAKNIMLTAEAAVLSPVDTQIVQTFYEHGAVNSTETAINNYFTAILAGNDPTAAKNIMLTAEAAVLAPADVQTVQAFYEQIAVRTAEGTIDTYFEVILAGNDPTAAKNIMLTAEATVLSPADVQTVQAYYEQAAVKTAETAINNYFTIILAGNDPTTAKAIMLTAEATILSPADVQTVQTFYQIESLYVTAVKAINQYKATPNAQTLQNATNTVVQLRPYNSTILPSQHLGVFDLALSQLFPTVIKNLKTVDDFSGILPPATAQAFATTVAINGNDLLVSDPQNIQGINWINSGGLIDEYTKTSGQWILNKATIQPVDVQPNDNFGTAMVENGNFLAVANNPAAGGASVYIFYKVNNVWQQEAKLNLASDSGLPASQINNLVLALDVPTGNVVFGLPTLVIGIPSAHTVMVYQTSLNIPTSGIPTWVYLYSITPAPSTSGNLSFGASVAIKTPYIVVGAPNLNASSPQTQSQVFVYQEKSPVPVWGYPEGVLLNSTFSNPAVGFGRQVGLGQGPSIMVGSWSGEPQDSGKIWVYNQTISNGVSGWGTTAQEFPVMSPLGGTNLGNILKVNNDRMIIQSHGTITVQGESPIEILTIPVTYNAVYKFNAAGDNNWDWQYTAPGALPGPVDINGDDLAIVEPPAVLKQLNGASSGVVQVISPKQTLSSNISSTSASAENS